MNGSRRPSKGLVLQAASPPLAHNHQLLAVPEDDGEGFGFGADESGNEAFPMSGEFGN